MRAPEDLLQVAGEAVGKAQKAGADEAEAYVRESLRLKVSLEGDHAWPQESHGLGVGVRVAVDGRLGHAGTSGVHLLDRVVGQALDRARSSPPHPRFRSFVKPQEVHRDPTPVAPALQDPDPARLEELARQALDGLRSPDTTYRGGRMWSGWGRFAVVNSHGVAAWDQDGSEVLELETRLTRGTRALTAMDARGAPHRLESTADPGTFAEDLVERARGGLDPTPLDGSVDAVVLDAGPAGQLAQKLTQTLHGPLRQAGQSPLDGAVGDLVASRHVTIRDLPHGAGVPQRRRIDHEGVPTRPRPIVEEGVVRSVLHDSTSAHHEGVEPTGHGIRTGGWEGGVSVRPVHLRLDPGTRSREDLLEEVDRAVLVTDPFKSLFTMQVTTGEFSLVAPYAYLVEDGEVVHGLGHTTVAGNVLRLFEHVEAVGSELTTYPQGSYPAIHASGGVTCAT